MSLARRVMRSRRFSKAWRMVSQQAWSSANAASAAIWLMEPGPEVYWPWRTLQPLAIHLGAAM